MLTQYHIVAEAQNGPLAKTLYCYFNPLLLILSFAWHFSPLISSLIMQSAFQGMRLQQPFYFWGKITGLADSGGLGADDKRCVFCCCEGLIITDDIKHLNATQIGLEQLSLEVI